MRLIWRYTYVRIEYALKLIIVSDTVQRRCSKPARFNSDESQHWPVRGCESPREGREHR